jgi:two-component sensor histidine kinase
VGLFLRETHHRMKNTLTLLGAWLRADFRSTASVDLPTAIDGFERRIVAFGRLYDLLSNGSDRRYTCIGDYVGSISRALTVAILEPKGIRCEATVGYGFLETKRCERLGLIIAELVTNAARVSETTARTDTYRGILSRRFLALHCQRQRRRDVRRS